MTRAREVLENHTLVVRDGRILEVLPSTLATERYASTIHVDRAHHVVLPGLVNALTQLTPQAGHDAALAGIAEMLAAGTTCFCGTGFFPDETARTAMEQGVRALIGIPIAESPSPWAKTPGEYLTRALNFRDEYRGHPTLATAFAPQSPCAISEATFLRVATLADELDAGIIIALHESRAEIEEFLKQYGQRPLERLDALGLLTPALTGLYMAHVNAADLALAQRGGIAITLCPEATMRAGHGLPPVAAWAASQLRLSLGSGIGEPAASRDLWTPIRLLALLSQAAGDAPPQADSAWEALTAATCGGAAALGLDGEIGTLERGKWADVCCLDLQTTSMQRQPLEGPHDAATRLVFNGGRDLVSDVWVAGRHLLNLGAFTRLDLPTRGSR